MEKVVGNEESIECLKGGPVIYVHSSADFKITWKEKMHEKK